MTDTLTIRRPDDWHVHLRDGDIMRGVVPYTARQFARAIVMPNLSPPVTSVEAAAAYRERILAAVPEGVNFTPLMTAYLTDASSGDELARGFAEGRDDRVGKRLQTLHVMTHRHAGHRQHVAWKVQTPHLLRPVGKAA